MPAQAGIQYAEAIERLTDGAVYWITRFRG